MEDSQPTNVTAEVAEPAPPGGVRDVRILRSWLTLGACAACILVFVGVNAKKGDSYPEWVGLLCGSAHRIWGGTYWPLITSVLVHFDFLHLAFNVYWLWVLGEMLERTIGSARWLALFLVAAVITSAAQLAVSGDTGVGASGVLYAFVGFMWVTRGRYPEFGTLLTPRLIVIFIGWLIFCFAATYSGAWTVGNAAHLSGLLLGIGVGIACSRGPHRVKARVGVGLLSGACIVPLLWCPWQLPWVEIRAYRAHMNHDYAEAAAWYHRALDKGSEPRWVWWNLADVYIELGDTARYEHAISRLREHSPEEADEAVKELTRAAPERQSATLPASRPEQDSSD